MIDFLKGPVVHWDSEYVVLDVRDVGYRVFTPNPYAFARSSDPVTVFIHHHVREDAIQLFGFASRDEQTMFRKLLEVSGIGPRVALGVLAGGKPEAIVAAIQQENINFLTKLPGIGKKTAQRMILDLKDKLGNAPLAFGADASAWVTEDSAKSDQKIGPWAEAREALEALGYTGAELNKAYEGLRESIKPDESVDSLMKRALQQLFKG
ncbi:Holliday junction DNA helicase subunit RuvA [Paenibacillus cellulosilyticus]|uniref:Holliday junction branch migration complex subunit RuvA n=1 Tax=Paenibacillus cellulosilyticus TaxID=375489 RepID=A0A2V2YJP0_9BACL|nr:Holliday junction branch migration protein RuvA [Paenibacillus cellulosilyticus]PWV91978.1 Holliday junction DNA helicase subunit RuvA [Paenibacillus cellulosilyticus]QKS46664.1 Holliday junction branch migration protein RuvA [Paenibacillus cellulosilyticus]